VLMRARTATSGGGSRRHGNGSGPTRISTTSCSQIREVMANHPVKHLAIAIHATPPTGALERGVALGLAESI
jgi:hypothetical protein